MPIDRRRRRCPAAKLHALANALRTTGSTLFAAGFYGGDFGEIWREIVCGERLDIHFD
jgi:hypothetical protein